MSSTQGGQENTTCTPQWSPAREQQLQQEEEGEMPLCFITLYELIVAIQDLVGPQDDARVVATVVHLLQSQRLTMLRAAKTHL
jgi:hypothetical protein